MAAPRFLVARLPAAGSYLLEHSRRTPLRADLMQEERQEQGGRVQVASLLVLRDIDSEERRVVLRELAARYRRVEDVASDQLPPAATLHRLVIGEHVIAARGLGALSWLGSPIGPSWSRISHGVYELWVPLAEGADGAEQAARLHAHYQEAGTEVQTRVAAPSPEDLQVWRLLVELCA
jgi:hypothetical protein